MGREETAEEDKDDDDVEEEEEPVEFVRGIRVTKGAFLRFAVVSVAI